MVFQAASNECSLTTGFHLYGGMFPLLPPHCGKTGLYAHRSEWSTSRASESTGLYHSLQLDNKMQLVSHLLVFKQTSHQWLLISEQKTDAFVDDFFHKWL